MPTTLIVDVRLRLVNVDGDTIVERRLVAATTVVGGRSGATLLLKSRAAAVVGVRRAEFETVLVYLRFGSAA